MIKSKKQMFIVIGVFCLILLLGTTTYAFFNYTRTGSANTIRVGRIYFNTNQNGTINLNNLFPIDPTDSTAMNDPTKVGTIEIEIEGDTDYVGGIEYLVSSVDSNIYTSSGKTVPITLDVTVNNDLGTSNANYFTARENTNESIYKKLVGNTLVGDQMLLVGYIVPNTTSGTIEGIDGSITIKAYLDKNNILISDTYDGTESDNMGTPNSMAAGKAVFTTQEWNALQSSGVSFKVKVEANEGIWVTGSLEEIMRMNSIGIDTQNGVDFSKTSEQDNTTGVYTRAGTNEDDYPIFYYRGAVEDNNVVFANKCWKAVRTTDTGGVKLIYNGEMSNVYESTGTLVRNDYVNVDTSSDHPFQFDNVTNKWSSTVAKNQITTITFSLAESGDYSFDYYNPGGYYGGYFRFKKNGTVMTTDYYNKSLKLLNVQSNDVFTLEYMYDSSSESTYTTEFSISELDNLGMGCDNSGYDSQISLTANNAVTHQFSFNTSYTFGYMNGMNVSGSSNNKEETMKFGSSFIYNNGMYTLVDTANELSSTRHYTCFNDTGVCDGADLGKIYYVYEKIVITGYSVSNNYVTLQNGMSIEQLLNEVQTNSNDSNAKTKVDSWYESTMTSYTNKLEDTVYCNDRSMNTTANHWNPNGGSINETASYFSSYGRITQEYTPSLNCSKNDSFTVHDARGNGALSYPVALITSDEAVLAGLKYNTNNQNNYLISNSQYHTMTEYYVGRSFNEYLHYITDTGKIYYLLNGNPIGLRPVISIKPGQFISSGSGTVSDPYVIE